MSRNISRLLLGGVVIFCALALLLNALPAWGQQGAVGTVSVVVIDQSNAIVRGAKLTLQDLATNDTRTAVTDAGGTFTFSGLPIGTYKLTVNMANFAAQIYDSVIVQGGRETPVKVTLRVGAASEEVVVTAAASPILETGSNAIGSTIDMKQIEDLPLGGRDVSQLAFLTPGYSGTPGFGTWDGMPVIAQGNTIDGVISSTSRMKFAGNVQPGLQARLEDIQEMTVQTSQMDVNQGYGASTMQSSFVTKRGSNSYHGEAYEDFRNSWMNANSWFNNAQGRDASGNANAPKPPLILNDFGGSVGGPILKDKLFFFGSYAESKQPGGFRNSNVFLTPLAQSGVYTYQSPSNSGPAGTTVNLYSQIASPNGLPTTPNASYLAEQGAVNTAVTGPGASVCATCTGDPNTELVSWFIPSPQTMYFPAVRLDYNISQKYRLNFAYEETKYNQPGASAPFFPGSAFASQAAFNKNSNYTTSIGFDWTVTPALMNQFQGGYFYNWYAYGFGAKPLWDTQPFVAWGIADSGTGFNLPVSTFYPIVNASDNATWQHSAHTVTFGFSFYREQDHYWNPPDGIQNISLGLAGGDPALTDFDNYFGPTGVNASGTDTGEAENLYATLIGRIAGVGPIGSGYPYQPSTGGYANTPGQAYNLDELQKSWGLYAQDSYHFKPTLTINYGLRWDFTGDDHDLTSAYHGTSLINMYGPTLPGQIFKQGASTLSTNINPQYVASSHQYAPWNVTPQPTLGVAWNPNYTEGFLGRFLGGGKTVIRAGFDIKRFTEPYQYFWNNATNRGLGFFQFFSLTAQSGGAPGTFTPGTLTLGAPVSGTNAPAPFPNSIFLLSPPAYQASIPMTDFTWSYYWGASGFDPKIQQPYVQEWNLGIQREIGHSNVLEVRYMGHRSVHQWISTDPNEVNIFENGFLTEFQHAQSNLAINQANGINSFANNSSMGAAFAGDVPLPIFDAAFAGEPSGGTGIPLQDYGSGSFIRSLQQGAAGSVAGTLAKPFGNAPYICNLTGSNISSCTSQFGFTTPGAYPVNFFQTNPYAASCSGCSTQSFMEAGGYGDYHALAIDFRQRPWHGMQFDTNYTWSHTLGLQPDEQWLGTVPLFTMRNLRLGYGPTLFDLRHVVHASGTYDLPFGNGKAFLNHPGVINQIVGGWTLGSIFTYETGFPFNLHGGFGTFNDYADGGLVLSGVTRSQLQGAVGVHHVPSAFALDFNPSILTNINTTTCRSHLTGVCQNIVPGTLTGDIWLYGPHLWNDDLSLSKIFPIRENVRFVFQSEFLNAFNHPNWANPNSSRISSGIFGRADNSNMNGPRQIEFRARLDF